MRPIMLRAAFMGLSAWLIVAISPHHASAEARTAAEDAGALANFQPMDPPRPVTDKPFADTGVADGWRTLADYRGNGVVLNFWATWCAPCVRELPSLDRLHAAVADDGIHVLTLSLDRGGTIVIRRFFEKLGIRNLPVLVDRGGQVFRKFHSKGLPTTVLIDSRGFEIGRVTGPAEWDTPGAIAFIRARLGKARKTDLPDAGITTAGAVRQ